MSPSFVCEHTAEYLLTRRIVDVLLPHFASVIPIHYWVTREGASMARRSMAGRHVRVVPIYARRPKITKPGQDQVQMKVNYQLFEAAAVADKYGLPMLAGLPLVSDFTEFSQNANCTWFGITAKSDIVSDYAIDVSINDPGATPSDHPDIKGPIPENLLAKHILSNACTWSWEDVIHIIRVIKNKGAGYGRFFGRGYQPFFVILPGDTAELQTLDKSKYMDLCDTC